MKLKVNVKRFSRKQNEIAQLEFDYPKGPEEMKTVRELLTETVKLMVAQYEERMDNGEALTALTKQEIEDKSRSGKISFGVNYGEKRPDLEKNIEAALECFEDGMVVLFVDGEQAEELTTELTLQEGSELTFIRMTPLAGRMW